MTEQENNENPQQENIKIDKKAWEKLNLNHGAAESGEKDKFHMKETKIEYLGEDPNKVDQHLKLLAHLEDKYTTMKATKEEVPENYVPPSEDKLKPVLSVTTREETLEHSRTIQTDATHMTYQRGTEMKATVNEKMKDYKPHGSFDNFKKFGAAAKAEEGAVEVKTRDVNLDLEGKMEESPVAQEKQAEEVKVTEKTVHAAKEEEVVKIEVTEKYQVDGASGNCECCSWWVWVILVFVCLLISRKH